MKNINVVQTDKPSRLIYNDANQLCYQSKKSFKNDRKNRKKFYMYITSDEEIKVNDYITDGYKVWKWKDDSSLLGRKKVILTTDQDLIKDGVQAIDDEFLEWFVKNPSCESFKVDKNWNYPLDKNWEYKIIIPKEEPKQQDEFAIGFAEWCIKKRIDFFDSTEIGETYTINGFVSKYKMSELLEMFKKEKGL